MPVTFTIKKALIFTNRYAKCSSHSIMGHLTHCTLKVLGGFLGTLFRKKLNPDVD